MSDLFFTKFPEFVENDNRKTRVNTTVTVESLSERCQTFLPEALIRGKRVLDIGCCIGAMGHYCLSVGATKYVGVEPQQTYADTAKKLLSAYWTDEFTIVNSDVDSFFSRSSERFDVVIALGVIYAVQDTVGFLTKLASICDETIVLDSMYPVFDYSGKRVIEIVDGQKINCADSKLGYSGIGFRPTPEAIDFILRNLGFQNNEGFLKPKHLVDVDDPFNDLILSQNRPLLPSRFAFRFNKVADKTLPSLQRNLVENNIESLTPLTKSNAIKTGQWSFDDGVAERFQSEAEKHIPDYNRVIDLSLNIASVAPKSKEALNIIDVGSAIGFTVGKFIDAGFCNTYGVECSESMIAKSIHKNRIFATNTFPTTHKWDIALANWTLHFIKDRYSYLESIFNGLNDGGYLILTDKMDGTIDQVKEYYDFKRTNGVTQEEIVSKAKALEGVLITLPIDWYYDSLKRIGFKAIAPINTKFMFNTLLCVK